MLCLFISNGNGSTQNRRYPHLFLLHHIVPLEPPPPTWMIPGYATKLRCVLDIRTILFTHLSVCRVVRLVEVHQAQVRAPILHVTNHEVDSVFERHGLHVLRKVVRRSVARDVDAVAEEVDGCRLPARILVGGPDRFSAISPPARPN